MFSYLISRRAENFSFEMHRRALVSSFVCLVQVVLLLLVNLVAAVAQNIHTFDIKPQSLSSALLQYSEVTGRELLFDSAMVHQISTNGVVGTYPPEEALRILLQDTGLSYQLTSAGTIKLIQFPADLPAASPKSELPPTDMSPQVQADAKPLKVQEIVVKDIRHRGGDRNSYIAMQASTATQTDTPLIETPRSISVVTTKQIETLKHRGINEALRYTAGLVAEPRGPEPNRSEIFMRGFRSEDIIYRDGLKGHGRGFLSSAVTTIDTYGVERIEVLRGPASVLYGQGLPSGLVNMVTKKPTEYSFGELETNIGSYQQYMGRFDLGGPIDYEKKWLFRLTGLTRGGNAQVDFVDTGRLFIAPAATWRPSSATTITLLGQYQWDDSYDAQFVPAAGSALPNPNGRIARNRFLGEPNVENYRTNYASIGYLVDQKFGEAVSINHKLRFENFTMDRKTVFANGFQGDGRTVNRLAIPHQKDDGSLFTTNTNGRFKFQLGPTENTALMGIDYKLTRINRNLVIQPASPLDAYNPVYGQPIIIGNSTINTGETISQVGLYFQHQTKVFDHLVATFGGRQDWADSDLQDRISGASTKRSDSAFTYQGGVLYLLDNGLAPYFNYATSFEPQGGTTFSGSAFIPTTGTQYEVGIKYQPPGYNSLLTFALFDLTRQNVLTPDPVNLGFSVQTGEVRSRGIEVEGKVNPFENLNVIFAYTYTDPEVTKSNNVDLGKKLPQIPRHASSIWGDYTIRTGVLKGVGVGSGVRYIGESPGNNINTFEVASNVLVDAMISYDVPTSYFNGLRLAINASNLLDKTYVASCSSTNGCFFGWGRDVRGSITYRW